MDQEGYYQERLEVESLQQRLYKTKFLEDEIEIQNYYAQPSRNFKKQQSVSYSDTEIKSTKKHSEFQVLYKRTTPLNIETFKDKKHRSQCFSESKSHIGKIRKRISKKMIKQGKAK